MKKVTVILDFIRISVPDKVGRGNNTTGLMTGNPNFLTPDVPLGDLADATELLNRSYLAALGGGKQNKALMHQAEKAWEQLMRDQAKYVDRIAKGDVAIILSAGFNASRQPTPAKRPEFSAVYGDRSGSVILRCKAIQGAYSYVWQYCKGTLAETEGAWTFADATGKVTVTIENLTPFTKYWFRVAAVMAEGTAAFSKPIELAMV